MNWKTNKETFLRKEFPDCLEGVKGNPSPLWGKMTFQGMIEHMSESIAMGYGKYRYPKQVDDIALEKLRSFMLSDKVFRPGTPNSIIGDNPLPLRFNSTSEAIRDLRSSIEEFFKFYETNPEVETENPFFGMLNKDQWVHLLCKHAWHHLNQFGIVKDEEYAVYFRDSARS